MTDYSIAEGTPNWGGLLDAALVDIDSRLTTVEGESGSGVTSVNGQTGVVSLTTSDVGAADAVHTHAEADITGLVADLAAAAASGPVSSVASKTGAVTLVAADITDATTPGKTLLTAANVTAQRAALNVTATTGLAAVALSGSATDLADRLPNANLPVGSILFADYDDVGLSWPARPTADTSVKVIWTGADESTPPPGAIPGDKWDRPA